MTEDKKRTIWPILSIDDEPEDVADLESVLDAASTNIYVAYEQDRENFPYYLPFANLRQSAANPEEALDMMLELKGENQMYSAIISDNHMKGENGESISGDDFLRIITGRLIYCLTKDRSDSDYDLQDVRKYDSFEQLCETLAVQDDEVIDFMDRFENIQNYVSFVDYFFSKTQVNPALIMLCGNPREADLAGLDNVYIVQKQARKVAKGTYHQCEREIINHLFDSGILPREFTEPALRAHPRLGENVSPTNRLFRSPKKRKS